jgi:hypothetical protein
VNSKRKYFNQLLTDFIRKDLQQSQFKIFQHSIGITQEMFLMTDNIYYAKKKTILISYYRILSAIFSMLLLWLFKMVLSLCSRGVIVNSSGDLVNYS